MISVRFQGKPYNNTVIQVYALISNAEEAEVEQFHEHLQDLLERTPPKRCSFHYRGLKCKSRKSRDTWRTGKFGLGVQNEAEQRQKLCKGRVLPRECTGHSKHPLPTMQAMTVHVNITR